MGNNLSLLILCTWVPNQELPSITACVLFLLEPATTNGEERASWPPGVVGGQWIYPLLFLPFSPNASFGLACLGRQGDTCPEDCIQHALCGLAQLFTFQIRYSNNMCGKIFN